ncbi:MAG: ABC transporter permease [Tissierellia bacterium]|nr:ABC transporter permease [Tissierellia bacterium]
MFDCFKKFFEYSIIFFFILTLNFFIPRLMPGDPFTFLSSDEGGVHQSYSEEQIEMYKAYYGMDKPLQVQYSDYFKNLIRGNLGYSIYYNDNVLRLILRSAKWTLGITLISLLISTIMGTILGSLSAWYRNSIVDRGLYPVMILLSEIPAFLMAILLLFTLAAKSSLFPLSGGITVFGEYETWFDKLLDVLHHGFLPSLSLTLSQLGGFYLLARNSMITVISKDYMRTALAKGLSSKRIILRHGLRNSILPIITRVFMSLGSVLGGAILVENVFNYPGLGRLMREAVTVRDYVLIQGIFLVVAFLVLAMNLLADVLYKKIDPRVG